MLQAKNPKHTCLMTLRLGTLSVVLALPVMAVLLAGSVIQAQTVTGTLLGTVQDKSGAAIPSAKVTIVNKATNIARGSVRQQLRQLQLPRTAAGDLQHLGRARRL